MARRRHSVRHRKRKNNRTRSKRGGEFTPPEEKVYKHIPLYNPKTGQVNNNPKPKFFNPAEISKESQIQTSVLPTDALPDISAEELFSKPPGYYSKESVAERKRTAAEEEYKQLMDRYKKDNKQEGSNEILEEDCVGDICPFMGGRKSRRHRRKTKKTRKSRRRSKH
jgi:hypothetical protein